LSKDDTDVFQNGFSFLAGHKGACHRRRTSPEVGVRDARHHFDGGGFAGPVGADITHDVSIADMERNVINGLGNDLFGGEEGFEGAF
jgi:hypothetical protein